jgi:hypothetical protein
MFAQQTSLPSGLFIDPSLDYFFQRKAYLTLEPLSFVDRQISPVSLITLIKSVKRSLRRLDFSRFIGCVFKWMDEWCVEKKRALTTINRHREQLHAIIYFSFGDVSTKEKKKERKEE